MRYIIRRPKAEDLSDLSARISNLTKQLGQAGENLRRSLSVVQSPMRSAHFKFMTRKQGNAWQWVCPSIELVGESEMDLLALTETFGVEKSALKHLDY